jgi:BlaI family transcriptional regulator, penicillinase repressor
MAGKRSQPASLSPAQREIMEIVWESGEVSASQVRAILSRQRDVARNTVRTLLERMEQKGWLTHRKEGRTYLYSAAQPRQMTVARKVMEVIDDLCGGSPEALVTALLDYRGLTDAELKRIRAMLDESSESTRKPED